MSGQPDILQAVESHSEAVAFVEAFARVTVEVIRQALGTPEIEAQLAESELRPDWFDPVKLEESGLAGVRDLNPDAAARLYLHIDVACAGDGKRARALFLAFTGLSKKQQRILFPALSANAGDDRASISAEVKRLNAWLADVRSDGFDPAAFVTYQRGLAVHGKGQNLSGAIGAAGATVAFVDAIRSIAPDSIVGTVGELVPQGVGSPKEIFSWRSATGAVPLKAVLLSNGRAVVFASSKDVNIFTRLGEPFTDAGEALRIFNSVRNDQRRRSQVLHEFAVGEVKTATDLNNLHERMGLASRETQTELRTDRFLLMSVLNADILKGGVQRRTMNNRDLVRFSHVFNLHHCWGWDGGRQRHPEHWEFFRAQVAEWCGL